MPHACYMDLKKSVRLAEEASATKSATATQCHIAKHREALRPGEDEGLARRLQTKIVPALKKYCGQLLAQMICARFCCEIRAFLLVNYFEISGWHIGTDQTPIVRRFTKIASVHYSTHLILRIPPNIPAICDLKLLLI